MKAQARQIITGFEIPDYARGNQDLWTPKEVKEALVNAFVVLDITVGRVGPRGAKAAWPQYLKDVADLQGEGSGNNPTERTAPRRVTREDIKRSEFVLEGGPTPSGIIVPAWLAGSLKGYPEIHGKLTLWCLNEAGRELGRGRRSIKAICKRRHWAYSTFNYHRDKAAGMIAVRLNKAGVEVWIGSKTL